MTDIAPALSSSGNSTIITIEVAAGSKTASFPAGYNPWRNAVGCRVRAPAVEGKANREVITAISERIGVGKTRVHILSGGTSSIKRVLVEGITPDQLKSVLSVP